MFCWRDFSRVSWGCLAPLSLRQETVVQGVVVQTFDGVAVEGVDDLTLILWFSWLWVFHRCSHLAFARRQGRESSFFLTLLSPMQICEAPRPLFELPRRSVWHRNACVRVWPCHLLEYHPC